MNETLEVNNKPGKLYFLLLTFSPLLGLIVEALLMKLYFTILRAFSSNNASYFFDAVDSGFIEFYFVVIIMFVGLAYLDRKDLEKRGFDVATLQSKFWLPPVYLLNRAKMFNKSGLSSILWLVQFAFTMWVHYIFYSVSL